MCEESRNISTQELKKPKKNKDLAPNFASHHS
jgi:hypothetical protein